MLKRTYIYITIVMILSSIVLSMGIYYINLQGITLFENSEIENKQELLELYIEDSYNNLGILNRAHSYWTQANIAVSNEDAEWVNDNLTEYIFVGDFDVDFVFLSNEDGSFVSSYGIYNVFIIDTEVYRQVIEDDTEYTSIVWYDGDAFIVSGYPISNDDKTDRSGVLLLGRRIDNEMITIIESIIGKDEENAVYLFETVDEVTFLNESFNTIIFESIDDDIVFVTQYELIFSTYVRERILRDSIITLAINVVVVVIILIILIRRFKKELDILMKQIHDLDASDSNYEEMRFVKASELNKIITSFNLLRRKISQNMRDLVNKNLEVVRLLSTASEINDPYTQKHSINVSELSRKIGKRMKLDSLDNLELSAELHDVGKVFIQLSLLNKKSKLSSKEFVVIKKHPVHGAELLENIKDFDEVRLGVLHHHEKFDGTGYPNQLKGEEIPLFAKIIHIADVYDAISSDRPYRDAYTKEKVISIMKNGRGTSFDPDILDVFFEVI